MRHALNISAHADQLGCGEHRKGDRGQQFRAHKGHAPDGSKGHKQDDRNQQPRRWPVAPPAEPLGTARERKKGRTPTGIEQEFSLSCRSNIMAAGGRRNSPEGVIPCRSRKRCSWPSRFSASRKQSDSFSITCCRSRLKSFWDSEFPIPNRLPALPYVGCPLQGRSTLSRRTHPTR